MTWMAASGASIPPNKSLNPTVRPVTVRGLFFRVIGAS